MPGVCFHHEQPDFFTICGSDFSLTWRGFYFLWHPTTSRLAMPQIFTGENKPVGIDDHDASIFTGENRADLGGDNDYVRVASRRNTTRRIGLPGAERPAPGDFQLFRNSRCLEELLLDLGKP
ncbi:hypothetical protein [Paraburkholderia ultramafica]|uniref:hypothetical protein n=1 Tax=Paraburkholderia ultramafica TaxID=1544867 RepID=UPI0015835FE6|nr:hypothetical protein [Paraburkholderia ultramafica]